jgi:hypothetical protein
MISEEEKFPQQEVRTVSLRNTEEIKGKKRKVLALAAIIEDEETKRNKRLLTGRRDCCESGSKISG